MKNILKTKFKKAVVVLTMLFASLAPIVVGVGQPVYAVDSAQTAYSNANGSGGVLGGVKDKVNAISSDTQSIVLAVVMGFLICSTLWTATKFSGAGDNPQKKATLKSALLMQTLGIVFVASYAGAISFGLNNLNVFA